MNKNIFGIASGLLAVVGILLVSSWLCLFPLGIAFTLGVIGLFNKNEKMTSLIGVLVSAAGIFVMCQFAGIAPTIGFKPIGITMQGIFSSSEGAEDSEEMQDNAGDSASLDASEENIDQNSLNETNETDNAGQTSELNLDSENNGISKYYNGDDPTRQSSSQNQTSSNSDIFNQEAVVSSDNTNVDLTGQNQSNVIVGNWYDSDEKYYCLVDDGTGFTIRYSDGHQEDIRWSQSGNTISITYGDTSETVNYSASNEDGELGPDLLLNDGSEILYLTYLDSEQGFG